MQLPADLIIHATTARNEQVELTIDQSSDFADVEIVNESGSLGSIATGAGSLTQDICAAPAQAFGTLA